MALTDEQIQELQIGLKDNLTKFKLKEGDTFTTVTNNKYLVVKDINEITQALAVSPLNESGLPNYQNTAIVVAGTQVYGREGFHSTALKSTYNAVNASGVFGVKQGHLTKQYEAVKQFYEETQTKIAPYDGVISNMSGFSQSGPAVAKVAADYQVEKVTNFMDWGSQMAVRSGDITAQDLVYLKEHATVYSDSGKDLTYIDGGRGQIAYGTVRTAEGSSSPKTPWKDHDPSFPDIKVNDLNIQAYYEDALFCSGMTREQVQKVSEVKASLGGKSAESYLTAYEGIYGEFASSVAGREELGVPNGARGGRASDLTAGDKRPLQDRLRELKQNYPEAIKATKKELGNGRGGDDDRDNGRG